MKLCGIGNHQLPKSTFFLSFQMSTCQATTAKGAACTHKAKPGQTVCGKHLPKEQKQPRVLTLQQRIDALRAEIQRRRRDHRIAADALLQMQRETEVRLIHLREAQNRLQVLVAANRDPVGDVNLAAFAADSQNVHRGSVQSASQVAIEVLLQRPVPAGQNTVQEIEAMWVTLYQPGRHSEEARQRFNRTCTELKQDVDPQRNLVAFDYTYVQVLSHVWASIKVHEHSIALCNRLFEEVQSGIGMCSNGKMTRLLNVLQGFDEQIVASIGRDSFQNKFATLTGLPLAERRAAAAVVFAEHHIPVAEQAAWLEPLMEA